MALKLFQLVFLSCLGSSALGLAHPLGHGKVSGHPTTLHQRLDAPRSPSASGGKAAVWIANKSPRSDVGQVLAAAASSSAEEGEGNKALDLKGGAAPTGNRGIGGKALPIVLLVILVLHKSVTGRSALGARTIFRQTLPRSSHPQMASRDTRACREPPTLPRRFRSLARSSRCRSSLSRL